MRNTLKATTLESKFPLLSVENDVIVSKDADVTVAFRVELPDRFDELHHRLPVLDFLRDDEPAAQRIEIALRAAALFGCLGQEQVAGVI